MCRQWHHSHEGRHREQLSEVALLDVVGAWPSRTSSLTLKTNALPTRPQ